MVHRWQWPLLGLLVLFLIHGIIPSYWNGFALTFGSDWRSLWDNEVMTQSLYSRLENPVFSRRLLTIHLLALGQSGGIPAQFAFILINAIAFVAIQFGLLALAESLYGRKLSMTSVSLPFTLSFSILFAFLASVCTYDDWLQYALLVWGLVAMQRRYFLAGSILFVAACCARETSLFFLPLWGWYFAKKYRSPLFTLLAVGGIALAYGLLLWIFWGQDHLPAALNYARSERFAHWRYNLQNFRYIRETTGVVVLVLGIPLWALLHYRKPLLSSEKTGSFWWFSIGLLVFNTIIVVLATRVREARLLYLPVLIMLALLAPYWNPLLANARQWIARRRKGAILLLVGVASVFTWWYWPTVNGTGYLFRAYA